MPHIQIGNKIFKFTQQRQKRKTISIEVQKAGQILIKTPARTSVKEACQVLQRYAGWIQKKDRAYEKMPCCLPITDKYITYKGVRLPIERHFTNTLPPVLLSDDKIHIHYKNEIFLPLADILLPWYKEQARLYMSERTEYWTNIMQVSAAKISIRDQKSRWGSCSSRHNISYNWRIMMAPEPVIDYLVIHEAAHLLQMNHSAKFWQIVESYDPHFKEHRLWLKQNGLALLSVLR